MSSVAREMAGRIEDELKHAHPKSKFRVWLTDCVRVQWTGGVRVSYLEIEDCIRRARCPFG
jgi:hypothetical protein